MSPALTKKFVCLANSRKPPKGRCVAGIELFNSGFGNWIRVVSARPTHEIALAERRYQDGSDPRVLDVITVALLRSQPEQHQQENYLIDSRSRWIRNGTLDWQRLQQAVEIPDGPLWLNGCSSQNGLNDRIPENRIEGLSRSLYLVRPEELIISVASEGAEQGPAHRRVRACFNLCGQSYRMVVTDPLVEFEYLIKDNGRYLVDESLLCISLRHLFHGHVYKLAATVITPRM